MTPLIHASEKGFVMSQRYQPITRLGLGGTGLGDMYHHTSEEAAQTTVDAA